MQQSVPERSFAVMKTIAPLLALVTFACPTLASAQLIGTYRVRAGLGAQEVPNFPGARSDGLSPYWTFSVAKGDHTFKFSAAGDSAGISLLGNSNSGLSAGPVASLSRHRDDKDVGAPVGHVPGTIELGGFVQYYPMESLRLRAEFRKGVGGHKGVTGFVGADQIWRDGDKYVFSIGPRLWFGDSRYERAYFGVSQAAALASGLPEYFPSRSFHAAGAVAGMQLSIGHHWGLFGYAQYQRLMGAARHSPIVTRYGSPNQFSVGIGIARTFTIKL